MRVEILRSEKREVDELDSKPFTMYVIVDLLHALTLIHLCSAVRSRVSVYTQSCSVPEDR